MAIFSFFVVLPIYSWYHENALYCFHWNFSRLDRKTLAAALDNVNTVHIVLLLTLVYSILAYVLLFSICYEMSNTEFTSQEEFIERWVSKHAVFIRGVNTEIGTRLA